VGRSITVVVTWMDGKQEVYRCARTRTEEGILRLIQDTYPASDEPGRSIPLANVRIWTVND
jgi:hypothetical protein